MPFSDPRAESDQAITVDGCHSEVGKLISSEVADLVLGSRSAFNDVELGSMPFHLSKRLIIGSSFCDGFPSDLPRVTVFLETPSFPEWGF